MSIINTVGSTALLKVFFAVLFTISTLASCGGAGESSTTIVNTIPTVNISAASTSISNGASTTISWSSVNSTSCTSSSGLGAGATGSFNTGALTATTAYTVTCTGAGGSASQVITISVAPAAPTVSVSATSTSITNGASTAISWSSTNSASCTASGSGGTGTTGSFNTGALTATTSYTVTCTGAGGSASQGITITVASAIAPTVSVSATSTSIANGASTTISWSSTNSTSCTSSGSGGTGTTGSFNTGALTATTTYTITCTGTGGSASQSKTITVAPTIPTVSIPTVSVSAAATSIANGASTTISWSSTNSTSCTSSGSGGTGTTGSFNTGTLTATTSYTITCTGTGGSASQKLTISVASAVPTVSVSAASTSIANGASTTISWSSTNSTSCTSSPSGASGISGSFGTGALTTSTTYTVTCTGIGGSASQSAKITVAAMAPTVTLTASPSSIQSGATSTISWSSTNSTSCTSSGGGGTGTTGNFTTPALSSSATYSVTCTGSGGTASQSKTVTVTASACSTTGATGAITLSNVPSRFTGVAPLSVFFDASGTTATTTTRPFHDLEYRWDFGDSAGSPVSGTTWKTGSRPGISSRNSAMGPEAAHVFETPGVYVVTLSATDGTNTVSNSCAQIVVQDPDLVFAGTNTICFSTGTNFAGCPSGAATHQVSSFSTAINTYQATGKRLLFKRGDTFTAGVSRAWITAAGPGTVGAFGTGAAPIMRNAGTTQIFLVGSSSPRNTRDWRIMDIKIDGASDTVKAHDNIAISAGGAVHEVLILRVNITGVHVGISANHYNLGAGTGDILYDGWNVQDSTLRGIPGCLAADGIQAGPAATEPAVCSWAMYMVGTRLAIQGNDADNQKTGGSHVIRSEFMQKGVIAHNRIANPGGTQHNIKLHASEWSKTDIRNPSGTGTYSELVVISDNDLIGSSAYMMSLGPQSNAYDERVRDLIVERNWVTMNSSGVTGIESSAVNVDIRNNLVNFTNSTYNTSGINVGRRGIEPSPTNVRIYNNTLYRSDSNGDAPACIKFGTTISATVMNNLCYMPLTSGPVMISGTPSVLVQSNNSTNAQVKSTFPGWVSTAPSTPTDFKLVGGSYALGKGVSVPVFSDFFLQTRTTNDLGAAVQ